MAKSKRRGTRHAPTSAGIIAEPRPALQAGTLADSSSPAGGGVESAPSAPPRMEVPPVAHSPGVDTYRRKSGQSSITWRRLGTDWRVALLLLVAQRVVLGVVGVASLYAAG